MVGGGGGAAGPRCIHCGYVHAHMPGASGVAAGRVGTLTSASAMTDLEYMFELGMDVVD